jgi:hypothetical protein
MWYDGFEKKRIDFKKPVFAKPIREETEEILVYILLPQLMPDSYKVIGFNWFNLKDGSFNCSTRWRTPQEAVEAYKQGHEIYNGLMSITKE